MKKKRLAQFEVYFTQFLNAAGEATQEMPLFAKDLDELVKMYREMVLMRLFETKGINLQRTGKIGTFVTSAGTEAIAAGIGFALKPEDVFVPAYREYATQFMRGVKMSDIFLLYGGDERGHEFKNCNDFPMCVPLATQLLHAAGVAKAMQHIKEKNAVLTVFGDGASSEGDAYEALNVAGVWNLPIVFVVNNNQWAISTPREIQTGAETIAQKAIAAGFEGEQIDGRDVIAMRYAAENALNKARKGGGPTLIEAVHYRLSPHTTADDPTRYMEKDIFEEAWVNEPIGWLRRYLEKQGDWSDAKEKVLHAECQAEIEVAVKEYESIPPQKPTAMFDYLYEEVPESLLEQYEELLENEKPSVRNNTSRSRQPSLSV